MNEILNPGTTIKTEYGGTVEIIKYLAEGGQGYVYVVDYNGKQMALKWYKPNGLGKEPEKFYKNIKNNIKNGTPSKEFLWPVDITEWMNGTFGYIMELRPDGYHEFTEFIHRRHGIHFKGYRQAVNAALKIVSAFRKLHNMGLSYQDLNDGNFFINPDNGKVLICDNDNVAPNKQETGILGKPRYMAPEIVRGEKTPDALSDRFSMAVILYIIFHLNHPLEGKRYLVPALSQTLTEKLYGTEPLFMMDPNDRSNAPDPVIHINTLTVWKVLPKYIQEMFLTAFSQEALHNPNARPTEKDWLNVLTRFMSEIIPCTCGKNEIFTQDGQPGKCDCCGKIADIPFRLEFRKYSIPAVRNARIYRCQLGVCNSEDALSPVARVILNTQDNSLCIINESGKRWDATTPSGKNRKVEPNGVVPLKDGIAFTVFDYTITIRKN